MSVLPTGYVEVEYIESDGKQYINTGFYTVATSVKYRLVYEHNARLSSAGLFGARESDPVRDSGWVNITSGGNLAVYIGSTSVSMGAQSVGIVNELTLEITSDTEYSYSHNGVTENKTYSGARSNGLPQYLFAVNTSGVMRYPSAMKVYAFSISENGNLVRNFVPCVKDNGETGMYDTVTATFFGNAGTGAFIAGGIVMSRWLITDRTETDIERVNELASKAWADMTAEERAEWLSPMKGSYNYTDLNRVEQAVAYVANRLGELGYLTYHPIVHEWSAEDIPNAEDLGKYFDDVAILRRAVTVWGNTPAVPGNVSSFGVNEANALEQILVDVDTVLTHISQAWFYSGELYLAEV